MKNPSNVKRLVHGDKAVRTIMLDAKADVKISRGNNDFKFSLKIIDHGIQSAQHPNLSSTKRMVLSLGSVMLQNTYGSIVMGSRPYLQRNSVDLRFHTYGDCLRP